MAKHGKQTKGETMRRKQNYMAKAGRRHVSNPNHPRPRPADQIAAQHKNVR